MSVPVIAFFNNKGGVGKTTLVFHLAWIFADAGKKLLAADLDPQANLTASFLEDDRLEELWPDGPHKETVFGCIEPLLKGTGDIVEKPFLVEIDENLHLLPGDLDLSRFEDELSQNWPKCLDGEERAFRVISAFWRIMQNAAREIGAGMILVDLGPNLGAINRSALVASDYLVVPLNPDLFSFQGLKNMGPTLRKWRDEWRKRIEENPAKEELMLPPGGIQPLGYVVMQHGVRADRPVKAFERWVSRIPQVYALEVLGSDAPQGRGNEDPNCLGLVKHYRSLMPMSMEARKPVFHLSPADGAIGAHYHSVREAGKNFSHLAGKIENSYRSMWNS